MRRSRLAVVPALAAAIAALAWLGPHDPQGVRDVAGAAGPWGPALLLAAWILGTPLLVPGTALCAAAGLLLGPLGVALSVVGSPLGALAAFGLGRLLGGRELAARLPARLAAPVARLERGGVRAVALVRLAPGVPAGLFNYACGATRVRARDFLAGSALGAAPRVVLYGALGGAAAHAAPVAAAIFVAAAGSCLVPAAWRRHRSRPGAAAAG